MGGAAAAAAEEEEEEAEEGGGGGGGSGGDGVLQQAERVPFSAMILQQTHQCSSAAVQHCSIAARCSSVWEANPTIGLQALCGRAAAAAAGWPGWENEYAM